jgi:hypothetical protein
LWSMQHKKKGFHFFFLSILIIFFGVFFFFGCVCVRVCNRGRVYFEYANSCVCVTQWL